MVVPCEASDLLLSKRNIPIFSHKFHFVGHPAQHNCHMRGRGKPIKRLRDAAVSSSLESSDPFLERRLAAQKKLLSSEGTENKSPDVLFDAFLQPDMQEPGFLVAPGMGSAASADQSAVSPTSTDAVITMIDDTVSSPQAAFPITGTMVRLNVGGDVFVAQRDTLLGHRSVDPLDSSESSFFYRLICPDAGAAAATFVDSTGAILIDRDPCSFAVILNYLRGYENALVIPSFLRAIVAQDADYYNLPGLKRRLADPLEECPLLFQPGPGIAPERRRFKPTFGINFISDRFFVGGRHSVTLEVLGADYLGIGVASDACVSQDIEFHRTTNCCVYYMSGVFYSAFPSPRKEEALESFGVGDTVEMHIDMDARILTYMFRGVTKVVSVKSAYRLRFAVTLKRKSGVRILNYASEN
jgi:hypothetical protein